MGNLAHSPPNQRFASLKKSKAAMDFKKNFQESLMSILQSWQITRPTKVQRGTMDGIVPCGWVKIESWWDS